MQPKFVAILYLFTVLGCAIASPLPLQEVLLAKRDFNQVEDDVVLRRNLDDHVFEARGFDDDEHHALRDLHGTDLEARRWGELAKQAVHKLTARDLTQSDLESRSQTWNIVKDVTHRGAQKLLARDPEEGESSRRNFNDEELRVRGVGNVFKKVFSIFG